MLIFFFEIFGLSISLEKFTSYFIVKSETCLTFFIGHESGEIVGLVPMADGSVQCLTCGKTLSSMPSAKRHYSLVHEKNMERVSCQICPRTFAAESYVDDHMRRSHGITKKMLKNRVMP